jgi:hypothetical protein
MSAGRTEPVKMLMMIEAISRKRNQPAPPWVVFDDLCAPRTQGVRAWLQLHDDENTPRILDAMRPNYVVWSSLWPARPDAVVRFELSDDAHGGTDLRWTLLVDDPVPDSGLIRHLRRRINEHINAELRFSYGQ